MLADQKLCHLRVSKHVSNTSCLRWSYRSRLGTPVPHTPSEEGEEFIVLCTAGKIHNSVIPAMFWFSLLLLPLSLITYLLPFSKVWPCGRAVSPLGRSLLSVWVRLTPTPGRVKLKLWFQRLQHRSKDLKKELIRLWLDVPWWRRLGHRLCSVHMKCCCLLMNSWFCVCVDDSNVYMYCDVSGTWTRLLEYDAIETCCSFLFMMTHFFFFSRFLYSFYGWFSLVIFLSIPMYKHTTK